MDVSQPASPKLLISKSSRSGRKFWKKMGRRWKENWKQQCARVGSSPPLLASSKAKGIITPSPIQQLSPPKMSRYESHQMIWCLLTCRCILRPSECLKGSSGKYMIIAQKSSYIWKGSLVQFGAVKNYPKSWRRKLSDHLWNPEWSHLVFSHKTPVFFKILLIY